MSKLIGYLAGPISNRTEEEMKDWRKLVKEFFPEVEWRDPTEYGRGDDDNEKVNTDIRNIIQSDIVVFMFDGPSIGTSMELRIAFEMRQITKYIIWWNSDDPIHLWVKWHSQGNVVYTQSGFITAIQGLISRIEREKR